MNLSCCDRHRRQSNPFDISSQQIQRDSNRMGMLDLIRPGGLGDFKVLVQSKNAPGYPLWGIHGGQDLVSFLDGLPIPLLTNIHMPLLEGRYPHLASDWKNYASYGS